MENHIHTIIHALNCKIKEIEDEIKRFEAIKNPNECDQLMISYLKTELINISNVDVIIIVNKSKKICAFKIIFYLYYNNNMDYYDIKQLIVNLDIMMQYKQEELSQVVTLNDHDVFSQVKINQLQYELTELQTQRKYYFDYINDMNNCCLNGCCRR